MSTLLKPLPLGHPSTWEPPTGAPFHTYAGMVHLLKSVQQQNDDALVLLDGLEGSGKSTVAFQLANHIDPHWEPETGLIIDHDDWEDLYKLERRRVFILDEGGDLMFSRDAMRGENKLVIRMFQMARIFNHILIVNCPNLHWVDSYVRNHRAMIYGHAHKTYHSGGVNRGLVTWHWPRRRFNWETSEWTIRWNAVLPCTFKEIQGSKWKQYEHFKRMKVEKRKTELQDRIRR